MGKGGPGQKAPFWRRSPFPQWNSLLHSTKHPFNIQFLFPDECCVAPFMLQIRRVLSTPVTFRFAAIRAPTLRPRKKPCRAGDQLPSRVNHTRNLKVLSLLFGISIMSQAMALDHVPVDLHQTRAEQDDEGLGTQDHDYDHYQFDRSSASALSDYSQTSDTPDASSGPPSRSTQITQPQEPLPQEKALQDSPFPPSPPPLQSPRSTKSPSVATSFGSPIRRKPLSPTASPLAVRFSARSNHITTQDLQEPEPASGFYSLDSPDLYDLSPSEGPGPVAVAVAPLRTPLEEESEEEFEGEFEEEYQ